MKVLNGFTKEEMDLIYLISENRLMASLHIANQKFISALMKSIKRKYEKNENYFSTTKRILRRS